MRGLGRSTPLFAAIAFAGVLWSLGFAGAAAGIAPLRWSQVPGTASRLAVAPDGSLWALATTPTGPDKYVLHRTNGIWKVVLPGFLADSLSFDEYGTLYVSNTSRGIFSFDGKQWSRLGGVGLTGVTVGLGFVPLHTLTSYIYAMGAAGKTGDRPVFELDPFNANGWVSPLAGNGAPVTAATEITDAPLDLNTYSIAGVGTATPIESLYSVASDGAVGFASAHNGSLRLPGRASSIALVPGGYVGLAYPASPRGEHIFSFDFGTGKATAQAGSAVSLVAGRGPDGAGTSLYSLDAAGRIWTAPYVHVDPTFTEFPGGWGGYVGRGEGSITSASDGALWFSGATGLGRITTAGKETIYQLDPATGIYKIVAGSAGDVWFTGTEVIAHMTSRGKLTEFPVNTSNGTPFGLALGSDGALWFTEQWWPSFVGAIGRITTDGKSKIYQLPMIGNGNFWPDFPGSIAAGRDGALWFTLNVTGMIGRITTSGKVSYYTIPSSGHAPWDIVAGPDGALWFTDGPAESVEYGYNSSIGRITTAGKITEFHIPSGSGPDQITVGSDGALWFTEYMPYSDLAGTGLIGRITTAGTIAEYPILSLSGIAPPTGIAAGADRAIWYMDGPNVVRLK
jgi:virginiamycin B lyase